MRSTLHGALRASEGYNMLYRFRRKHKHRWETEEYLNKRKHMVWYLRRCVCGAVEILNAGGTGDKKWHPFTGEFKFDWEKAWFEEAEIVTL